MPLLASFRRVAFQQLEVPRDGAARVRAGRSVRAFSATAATLLLAALLPAPAGSSSQEAEPRGEAERSDSAASREHLDRGIELARQGRHERAAEELRRHLKTAPRDPDGHFYLGRSLLEIAARGKAPLTEAIRQLEEASRLDPLRDPYRLQLAEVYGWRRPDAFRPGKAMDLYESLLERHPDRYDIRFRYARWLVLSEVRLARRGGEERVLQDSAWTMDLARRHLRKVIDGAPPGSDAAIEARTMLGEVQFRSGAWEAARATFARLISGYPDRQLKLAPAWNTVGHCHYRQGRYEAAARAFRKACDLDPAPAYRYDLRMAYDRLGGYPKDLPARYRFRLREEVIDAASPPLLKFTDIAPRLHIDKYGGAGPCGWADYDGDGLFDLIVCGCDTFCSLFRARGRGFLDATREAGLARLEPGFGAAWADYDNDGDPDLYIARNGWNGPAPNSLLRNNGDGTFTDVARAAGVDDPGSSFHATWLDYDRDGWLDLLVSNGVYLDGSSNQLYRNQADGTFRNVTTGAGLAEEPRYGTIGV
ncbi:MAG: FG-GAP-like repeat-containing protein, partial [Planctomycetota bacterium]